MKVAIRHALMIAVCLVTAHAASAQPNRISATCSAPPRINCPEANCPVDQVRADGNAVEPKTGRRFFFDYPCDLEPGEDVVFVLSLHGAGSIGNWQRHYFPIVDLKDKYRLVIATPTAATSEPTRRWAAEADDEFLRNVTDLVVDAIGADNIRSFWLAGHSQGGITSRRIICSDYFRTRVDGWLSLSGGRIGQTRVTFARAPAAAPATPASAAEQLPDCDFSFIYTAGELEIAGLPTTSPWAEKYGCGARARRPDIIDPRAGYVTATDQSRGPSWGRFARPGKAEAFVYPTCRDGKVVADFIRLDKGHTEGLEPNVLEEIVKLMVSARGGKAQSKSLPRFDRVVLLETTSETSANVHIGDVNGDGNLDIVLAKGRHWGLVDRVLIGDGRGGFPSAYDLGPASDKTYSGNLVDLDGDADLDVVISNDTPDPKRIYLNDGKGRFSEVDTYGRAQWSTRNAAVADVNGDRLPDIIVANRDLPARAANYVCLNRGQGQFEDDCFLFSRESATTITAADVNRDGRMDLVVPHRDGGQSHVYLNTSTGSTLGFSPIAFGPRDATVRASAAADLDRDGFIDIVAIDEKRGLFAFFGEGHDQWSAAVPIGARGRTPYALTVHDLNADGVIDVVVGHVEAPSTVFFTARSGRSFTPVDFGDGKGTAYGFDVADLDKDGQLDIAMARSDAPNVVYLGGPASSR